MNMPIFQMRQLKPSEARAKMTQLVSGEAKTITPGGVTPALTHPTVQHSLSTSSTRQAEG